MYICFCTVEDEGVAGSVIIQSKHPPHWYLSTDCLKQSTCKTSLQQEQSAAKNACSDIVAIFTYGICHTHAWYVPHLGMVCAVFTPVCAIFRHGMCHT